MAKIDPAAEFLNSIYNEGQLAGRTHLHRSMYLWNKSGLGNYIVRTLGDGTEMAHGIEGRLPYLDHKLFEFCRELPSSILMRNGVEKYLLRKAAGDLVTNEIASRTKHPFFAPPLCVTPDGKARESLRQQILSVDSPFADRGQLCALFDSIPHLSQDEIKSLDPIFLTLAGFAALQRSYFS